MILDPILDMFRGKAVTIPPLDGAFRPNTRLDDAPAFAELTEPDNLLVADGRLLASSGNAVYAIAVGVEPAVVGTFPSPVTALTLSPSGELTVGLESGKLLIAGRELSLPAGIGCITALAYAGDGTLWLANGSAEFSPSQWAADLMKKGASGSLWGRAAGGEFRKVAGDIAFPYGLHILGSDVLVSESWRHQLVRFDGATGNRSTVLTHLPGYPARLSPAGDGGAWLTLFAPRNRLIEFVLQETHYRQDMIDQVPPAYWIAPALVSNRSFLEPLQCGGIRTMGIHKPWSPSRSYGLVVRLDREMQPQFSLHSRANGTRHGICSVVEKGGELFIASRGGDCVLAVDLASGGF
ncbi:SMP-30/gluconolactonase/LRE family protein [Mesorhizobium sp. B2-5-13]|uniref:SMP-30/gluconolactonase/LRE family protein n=1 Tax=unclassified Mesorhizobium TaxID=325217 RepID=UPI00112EA2F1|nr:MULTISPECIES: SMP-30/gluconolactonase/LRE family protein [unclassified Mesorhizobium]TPJ39222.1 SMP-30/gluconolactonase/LRE family protein [Mesorhizobium sp. B2-6-5]TPJ87255.1 SMP-30/gluconolactonase/LRE family protein [Mesorhizobium sp. B2-5-13]TPK52030.1 SMP-30/gluconolactonase/LRE family protein [Mesorhizobium sp. B2-5-5]